MYGTLGGGTSWTGAGNRAEGLEGRTPVRVAPRGWRCRQWQGGGRWSRCAVAMSLYREAPSFLSPGSVSTAERLAAAIPGRFHKSTVALKYAITYPSDPSSSSSFSSPVFCILPAPLTIDAPIPYFPTLVIEPCERCRRWLLASSVLAQVHWPSPPARINRHHHARDIISSLSEHRCAAPARGGDGPLRDILALPS